MTIDGNTNIAKLIDEHPELLETFVSISPHFRKLENKFLRKTVARRVSVSDAAKVGGVDLTRLLSALNAGIQNSPVQESSPSDSAADVEDTDDYSAEFEYTDSDVQNTLDVREDISANRDPLASIMRAARGIGTGKVLLLLNGFEPIPLYEVLGKKGFVHKTDMDGETYRVAFKRVDKAREGNVRLTSEVSRTCTDAACGDEKVMEIDVRGLEPPEPMMRILKAINTLGPGTILVVDHHREPMFLYEKLAERGLTWMTNKVAEHHYKIVIRPKDGR